MKRENVRNSLLLAALLLLNIHTGAPGGEDVSQLFARFVDQTNKGTEFLAVAMSKAYHGCTDCQNLSKQIYKEWEEIYNNSGSALIAAANTNDAAKIEAAVIRTYDNIGNQITSFIAKYRDRVYAAPENSLCGGAKCAGRALGRKEMLQDAGQFLAPFGITDQVAVLDIADKLASGYDRAMLTKELWNRYQAGAKMTAEQYVQVLGAAGLIPNKAVKELTDQLRYDKVVDGKHQGIKNQLDQDKGYQEEKKNNTEWEDLMFDLSTDLR